MRSYNIIVSPYQKNTVDTQFYFKQNDFGIPVSITVEDYDTSGTTAKIVFRRADEVIREYNIVKSSDGTYKYNLSADEIYYPGKVFVDLKFYKDGVRESTASFIYHVITDKVGETFASGDYSDSIARAIESCNQAIANIQEQANQAIEDVENALLAELNIYDGYDKTTIGFAADARQLNENVVNSYAAKVKEKIDTNTTLINALNNNLLIESMTAIDTLASLYSRTTSKSSKKYLYDSNALPSDYPAVMTQAGCTFNPIVTVYRFGGIMYLEIISPNQTSGIPKTINGYYNGSFYWSSIQG